MSSPPEQEAPRWPLVAPLAAVFFGAGAAVLITAVAAGVLRSGGVHVSDKSPGFTALSTFVLDVSVVAASIALVSLTARPRAWQFGLRAAPLRFVAGIVFIALVSFYGFELLYTATFQPKNPQKIIEDLGADSSTLLLVIGALLVIVVAPVCEEFFFRG